MLVCENPYCGATENLTKHHVLPKGYRYPFVKHKNVRLCRSCHTVVHQLKSNLQLAVNFNTHEKVLQLLVENTIPIVKNDRLILIPIKTQRYLSVA